MKTKPAKKTLSQSMADAVAKREKQTGKRHVYANEFRGSNAAQLNRTRNHS
jgi:hypothetical protein